MGGTRTAICASAILLTWVISVCISSAQREADSEAAAATVKDDLSKLQRAAGSTDPNRADIRALSGTELVKLLLDDQARSKTYYELCRRHSPTKWKDFSEFYQYEFNQIAEVTVCPQANGRQPLYVVQNKWDTVTHSQQRQTSSAAKLPRRSKSPPEEKKGPLVFFTAEGKQISPYKDDPDMLDGFLGDLNKDGSVERVQWLHFNAFNWEFDIAEVSVVSEQPTSAVAIVYNWYPLSPAARFSSGEWHKQLQKERWRFRVRDRNGDGFYELEFGPKTVNGIEPKLTLHWDKTLGSYVCSLGKKGKHFQVIYPDDLRKSLGRLRIEGQGYNLPLIMAGHEQKQTGVKAYRYTSLKNLTNEQIVHYMGPGKKLPSTFKEKVQVVSYLGKNFWTDSARDAALVLAEVNRTLENRRLYRLSVDDSNGQKPPDICTLFFQYTANHFQFSFDFFVRCDPKGSHLVFALNGNTYSGSLGPCSVCFLKLAYDDARQITHTVWCLNRVKSLPTRAEYKHRSSGSWSSADGHAQLRLSSGRGRVELDKWGNVWYGAEVSEGWRGDYDEGVFLNLAAYVIQKELVPYLKERYRTYESEVGYCDTSLEKVEDKEKLGKFKEHAQKAFRLCSLDERNLPLNTVRLLAERVGEMGSAESRADLHKLLNKLPARDEQRLKELEKRRRKWEEELESFESEAADFLDKEPDPNTVEGPIGEYANLMPTEEDKKSEQIEYLRDAIVTAVKKIDAGSDPKALEQLAADELSWWAAKQLKKKDIDRYLGVLEGWLTKAPDWQQETIFEEIAETRPARARKIARKLRSDDVGARVIAALDFLEKDRTETVRGEDAIVQAVIRTALAAKIGSGFRRDAIESLVPYEDPKRYKTDKIDEALLKLLDPKLGEADGLNFTLGDACKALARRDGAKYFETVMAALEANLDETLLFDDLIAAVAVAAQAAGPERSKKLSDFLRSQLRRTRYEVKHLIWAAWVADFKDLRADLGRIATSGPDVCEDEDYSGPSRDVTGRYHLARKVASLWNEDDPITRGRLLIAFAFELSHFIEHEPGRLDRLRQALSDAAKELSTDQRQRVAGFLNWREQRKEHGEEQVNSYWQKERTAVAKQLRQVLTLSQSR
ncbi:MAG: hypothetical protein ACYS29_02555 [Planctomycetota bacterium]